MMYHLATKQSNRPKSLQASKAAFQHHSIHSIPYKMYLLWHCFTVLFSYFLLQ